MFTILLIVLTILEWVVILTMMNFGLWKEIAILFGAWTYMAIRFVLSQMASVETVGSKWLRQIIIGKYRLVKEEIK